MSIAQRKIEISPFEQARMRLIAFRMTALHHQSFKVKTLKKTFTKAIDLFLTHLPGTSTEAKTKSTEAINGDLLGLKV